MKKNIIIFLVVLVCLILVKMLFTKVSSMQIADARRKASTPVVTVEDVKTRELVRQFEANARIIAKYRVDVLARVSGYLTKSYFKEGNYVKKGQTLFEIEPQEYLYAANKAKANLDNIKSQSDYYNKQLIRYKELVNKDYVAKSTYDNALAQSSSFNAQVDSATNVYRDAQRNLGYTKIKAPVDGRVGIISVTVGNYVSPNSGALTTINSCEPMYVIFSINAKDYTDLVRIDKNSNVQRDVDFIFSTGQKYEYKGVQDFYDNQIDETTGTIMLRATFKNPDNKLMQGDFGRAIIYSREKDNIPVIPQSATLENQKGRFVYVIDDKGLPSLVYIKTMGQTEDKMWIVSEGLKANNKIITSGLLKVVPGQPVKILKENNENNVQKSKEGILIKLYRKFIHIIRRK